MALLMSVGGLLFYFETRYNTAAVKIRMALEKRRRSKRMRERREVPDASGSKIKEEDRGDLEVRRTRDGGV
jgi:hypothetical protein